MSTEMGARRCTERKRLISLELLPCGTRKKGLKGLKGPREERQGERPYLKWVEPHRVGPGAAQGG